VLGLGPVYNLINPDVMHTGEDLLHGPPGLGPYVVDLEFIRNPKAEWGHVSWVEQQ